MELPGLMLVDEMGQLFRQLRSSGRLKEEQSASTGWDEIWFFVCIYCKPGHRGGNFIITIKFVDDFIQTQNLRY